MASFRLAGHEACQPKPWRFSLTEGDGQEHDIPDLVNRDFTADAPGEKMVGDITYMAYIVFAANAFALLGLRALFFLVTGLLDRLVYLSAGLAAILAFIGVKLILHWGHGVSHRVPEISTPVSLTVIAVVLAVTTIASLIRTRRGPAARAHAGAVIGTPPQGRPGLFR